MEKWYIAWYEKEGEELIGEQSTELSSSDVRNVLDVETDNPLEGCWPIDCKVAKRLQEKVGVAIDIDNFDYFLESYS